MLEVLNKKVKIKEIFTSIQGEGVYVGEKHGFVRFCHCNLKCDYCDTDFLPENSNEYNIDELFNILKNLNCDTVSFTGGEPLVEVEFLYEFLKKYKNKLSKKIYLETNGTLYFELQKIIDFVDIVSMDIKLESTTKQKNRFLENEEFLKIAKNKQVFIKIVFDNSIKNEEIEKSIDLAKKYNTLIILQPKMPMDKNLELEAIFEKFYSKYKNIRLIPQVHKFLNVI